MKRICLVIFLSLGYAVYSLSAYASDGSQNLLLHANESKEATHYSMDTSLEHDHAHEDCDEDAHDSDHHDDDIDADHNDACEHKTENLPPHFVDFNPPMHATSSQLYSYTVTAEDPEGDRVSFSLPDNPHGMSIDENSGLITWIPAENQAGNSYGVTVNASDGFNLATMSYEVTVVASSTPGESSGERENHLPVFTGPTYASTTASTTLQATILASDQDADALTISTTLPDDATYATSTGLFRWTPHTVGTTTASFFAYDGIGTTTHQLLIEVFPATTSPSTTGSGNGSNGGGGGTGQNLPPQFVNFNPPTIATTSVLYQYDVDATDPENDPLTFDLTTAPIGMTIASSTGLISWIATSTQATTTPYLIGISVSDTLHTATTTYELTVILATTTSTTSNQSGSGGGGGNSGGGGSSGGGNSSSGGGGGGGGGGILNFAPEFIDFNPPTDATTTVLYIYDVNARDPENQPITFSLLEAPNGMRIIPSTGFIFWNPTLSQASATPYPVIIAVTDGISTTTARYTITVHSPTTLSNTPVTNIVPSQPNTGSPSIGSRKKSPASIIESVPTPEQFGGSEANGTTGSPILSYAALLFTGLVDVFKKLIAWILARYCLLLLILLLLTLALFAWYIRRTRKKLADMERRQSGIWTDSDIAAVLPPFEESDFQEPEIQDTNFQEPEKDQRI